MKIDERVSNYMALLNSEAAKPSAQTDSLHNLMPQLHDEKPDSVIVSPAAAQLSEDDARRERLEAIRKQLAEGSYSISGKDVANKMLDVLKG